MARPGEDRRCRRCRTWILILLALICRFIQFQGLDYVALAEDDDAAFGMVSRGRDPRLRPRPGARRAEFFTFSSMMAPNDRVAPHVDAVEEHRTSTRARE